MLKTDTRLSSFLLCWMVVVIVRLQLDSEDISFVLAMIQRSRQGAMSRRNILDAALSGMREGYGSIVIVSHMLTSQSNPAWAAIDVSGLKLEDPTATDVFLGGTYFPDDELDREGIDGRISRMKYEIELAPSSKDFSGMYRSVKVKGMSTAISSSRDDYIELSGKIFKCSSADRIGKQGGECISVDFSSIGGPKDVQGYWDEDEKGIRFVLDNKVWSKQ